MNRIYRMIFRGAFLWNPASSSGVLFIVLMIDEMMNLLHSQPFRALFQAQDAERPHFVGAVGHELFLRTIVGEPVRR